VRGIPRQPVCIRSYRGGVSLGACSSSRFQGQGPSIIVGGKPFTPMAAVSSAWSGGHVVEQGGEMEPIMDRDLSGGLAEASSGELASE
jgi:hypothetical protein